MSTDKIESSAFSTAQFLKTRVPGPALENRPRVKVSYNEHGEGQLPEIIYVTKTVVITKETGFDKTIKALKPAATVAVKGVVMPVSFLGYFVIFFGQLLLKWLKLWVGTYSFLGNIFKTAAFNISYVIISIAVITIPILIAYYGSMYIRPLYDLYHTQNYVMLGLYSVGIFLVGSILLGFVISTGRKVFSKSPETNIE